MSDALWPLTTAAQDNADETALVSESLTLSFREYADQIDGVAQALAASGIGHRDRVAIVAHPSPELVLLILACCRAGVVACPINPQWPVPAVCEALETVSPRTVIADVPHASLVDGSWPSLAIDKVVNTDACDRSLSACHCEEERRSNLPSQTLCTASVGGVKAAQEISAGTAPFSPDRPVTGVFTSGSTGEPKLALLTLRNHIASAMASNRNIAVVPGDRWLLSLPLHHVAGLAVLFRCMMGGAAVVVPRHKQEIPDAIERYGITHLSLVPTQLYRLLQDTKSIETLRHLKAILVGGGPSNPTLIRDGHKQGLRLFTTYGLTEMTSQVTTTGPDSQPEGLLSSGRPLIPSSVAISDDDEILVRGETLFAGYATQDGVELPLTDAGWFATGDLGHLDQHGNLHVTGRKDNRFVCGGENVQPEEIERHVCNLQGVAQCIVVPVDNDEFGSVPVAFIRTNDDKPFDASAAVVNSLTERIPSHIIPKAFLPWPQEAGEDSLKPDRRRLEKTAKRLCEGLNND